MKNQGGQSILSYETEKILVEQLITCSAWGYPLTAFDLRCIVKEYLDRKGKSIKIFKCNMPGRDFALSFLKRHKDILSQRLSQNIIRARTQVCREAINSYFHHLEKSLEDVSPENIINYDETNLSDNPG